MSKLARFQVFIGQFGTRGVLIPVLLMLSSSLLHAEINGETIKKHLRTARSGRQGVAVVDVEQKKLVFSHNVDQALKPASVMKVLTAATALRELGPGHVFVTRAFTDKSSFGKLASGALPRLFVMGVGDPSFTIERLTLFVRGLQAKGVRSIETLVLDSAGFENDKGRSGPRAYEAGTSALSFNFNAVTFWVCPTENGKPARISVDPFEYQIGLEGQITTTSRGGDSFGIDELAGEEPRYRVKGTVRKSETCRVVYRSVDNPIHYVGEVLKRHFELVGIKVKSVELGVVPNTAREIYSFSSEPLSEIIRGMNQFSNNFTAEQLVAAIGHTGKFRFDRSVGLERMEGYLARLGIADDSILVVDGSGLSHENRLSARSVSAVLTDMATDPRLSTEFEASLAVGGRNGTLKSRQFGDKNMVVRAKTGTINGVTSLAGFVTAQSGHKMAFVIFQNSVRSVSDARRAEERIVKEVYEHG